MSEEAVEKALFHLYLHIHESDFSSKLFEKFSLSNDELEWLERLISMQREGLLVFNRQLRSKGNRYIRKSLPRSAVRFGVQLDAILADYQLTQTEIGPRDPASAVSAFSDFLERSVRREEIDLRAFEFIRFESLFVAMSLDEVHPPEAAVVGSSDPRHWYLPPIEHCRSLSFCYDPTQDWNENARLGDGAGGTRHFLFFADTKRAIKIVELSSSLHNLINEIAMGKSVGEALDKLESAKFEELALRSIRDLSELGLPFTMRAVPINSARGCRV